MLLADQILTPTSHDEWLHGVAVTPNHQLMHNLFVTGALHCMQGTNCGLSALAHG